MWVHISAKSKNNCFTTQNRGGNTSQIISYKNIHNYCRKHRKFTILVILHNRIQNSEKFSPIVTQKLDIFSSATAIVLQTSINCSRTKPSKQQLTAHTSIVKGNMTKCHKHAPFSPNTHIAFTGVKKSTDISAQNTKQINLVCITNYNKNIS